MAYLIAHKVRGEPAFDIAEQMECPECTSTFREEHSCVECDSLGYWWIIPTSGHRAYPWWHWDLEATELSGGNGDNLIEMAGEMPEDLQDHYTCTAAPRLVLDFSKLLPKGPTIRRRI